ncbi:MAG: twin-arginine translocase subunit TatC [Myxococcaceae bacterium]
MTHLSDLRKVIVRALLGIGVGLIVCVAFSDKLLKWLSEPIQEALGGNAHLVVLAPHEYFFTEMKAALIGGVLLATPWVFYQIWLFVAPGLYKNEKKLAFLFVFSTAFFFVAGVLFAQYCVFPSVFKFFIGTLPNYIQGQYSIGLLFSFSTNLLLAFGLVFETPVLVFLLIYLDLVELKTLQGYRRYVIVLAFVIAAILTPTPDPLTQTLMALPIIVLYELGLFLARLTKFPQNQVTDLG